MKLIDADRRASCVVIDIV